ncbi:hypothetical protein ACFOHW_09935 [Paenibacillus abyssi]
MDEARETIIYLYTQHGMQLLKVDGARIRQAGSILLIRLIE